MHDADVGLHDRDDVAEGVINDGAASRRIQRPILRMLAADEHCPIGTAAGTDDQPLASDRRIARETERLDVNNLLQLLRR
jgi:hypothetical protein